MASSSINPNPCPKSARAMVIYQKLCKWPVTDRAVIDSKYVRDIWRDIYDCLNEAPSALLPKEIAMDIVARVPTNFLRWCFILRTIWNGKTDGLIQYEIILQLFTVDITDFIPQFSSTVRISSIIASGVSAPYLNSVS